MFAYEKVSNELRNRLESGYYVLRQMPSIRKLATEFEVSDYTVRSAINQLKQDGSLKYGASDSQTGTAPPSSAEKPEQLRLGLLSPQWHSFTSSTWQSSLFQAVHKANAQIRPIPYYDWRDPLLLDSIKAFDGCFINACAETLPADVAEKIRACDRPAVIIQQDTSPLGIPCIVSVHQNAATRLLDHLSSQGFKRISCLNAQPHTPAIDERVEQFELWNLAHGNTGELLDIKPEHYTDTCTLAYQMMKERLAKGEWCADVLVAITLPAALGAMTALRESNIVPGKDIGVCTIDSEGVAQYLEPPLTSMVSDDQGAFVDACLQWMRQGGAWTGPLLMQPAEATVAVRASTMLSSLDQ